MGQADRRGRPPGPAGLAGCWSWGRGWLIALLVPAAFAVATALLMSALTGWPWLRLAAGFWLVKSTFAVRALGEAGNGVRRALANGDLPAARVALGSLCSRDASQLGPEAVAAGAVESLAENASDSVVAPLFCFALFGLPGAIAYRAINTADAMIGYHGRHEYLGKAAARLDDLANWLPARLTAGLLLAAGAVRGLPVGPGLAHPPARRRPHREPERRPADGGDGGAAGRAAGEARPLPPGRRRCAGRRRRPSPAPGGWPAPPCTAPPR